MTPPRRNSFTEDDCDFERDPMAISLPLPGTAPVSEFREDG
jgi:hypothetical protein